MPADNSKVFSPQDLTRTEDQNRAFPNSRGQVVPAIESAPEEPQDWKTPMAKPENGFQPEGTPLTFEPRPKEVNKILNSKHVLSDVDTSDPSNARVFVANFLNSKYSEDKRGIYKDYEGKTKAYGLSGDPVADAKSILDGDTKTHESSQTRIAKDRKVIAEGLERLEPEEGQGFIEKQAKVVGSTGSKMGWSIFRSGLLLSGELFNDRLRDELRAEYDRSEGNKVSASNPIVSREELVDFSSKMVASTEKAFDVDPEYANTMEGAILSGLTQITAQIATGGLGLPAQMYDEGIQDAEASMGKLYSEMTMLEQAKARQLAGPYALVATGLEALPLGKMFKNLTGTTKEVVSKMNSKGFLKEFGAGFLGEGITESAQKQLLGELGKRVLEDGRDVWNVESLKDLAKEFLVAGTVGGIARGGPVAASKALNKLMDPVEGMSAVDMALAYNVIPEPEFNLYIEEQFGDQTTEEGVPLQELAKKARQGDRKAAEELVANTTVEASQAAVEAGLTPEEAEARGKEAAEVADPIEPLVETAIDKEISAKKEELAALEEAEDSTPEDMKVGEKLDKEIQALETKRDEKQRPTDVLSAQAREEAAAEEAGLLTRRAEDEIEIDKAEEVADAIDFFEQRSRGGVTKDYKPDTRKGGEALIKQMRRAGMSKKEIAAKSLQIMTEAGRPNDRLSDQVVRGEQTSNSKAGNDFRATVKLYKDADPMDVAEEYIHAETDREINEGTINYEDIAAYREQVESITSGEDTRGNTEGDHKEWIAEQVKARLLGNRHDTRLPESFARFIDRIISRLRNLFTRANELIELEAQGMLPDGFVELLDRLGSMDDDALMQSIQAEQAAETASDPKDELLEVMKRNKLSVPRPDSDPSHRGELETYFESIGKKWKYLKKGGSLDGLKEGLQAAGFNVDTPSDVLDLLDRSARGEAIYANTDSRSAAQQTADETFSLDPEVRLDRGAESSFSLEPEEYRGQHKAPNRTDEISASLDALGDVYPSNIYSSKALQYYRTGDDYMDRQSIDILQGLADDPDAKVTIHRAIPVDANKEINAGDWVTVNYDYAEMHGESVLNGDYVIVSEEVPASDVFTNADSIHEQGYDPKAPSFSLAPAPSGVEVSISEESDKITLNKLIVDKDARGSGKGSEYMNTLTEYADATGKRITLTPSKDFGGSSVSRLKAFYKRFGFVENKGKNKDFEEFDSMYREPTEPSYSLEPLSEQDADAIVTERTEEIQSRTPERQAFIDYQRELRRTQLDNTEEEKKKLQKLLQLATDADEIAELKQAGDEKIIRVVEQKVKQIRKQAAEREDVTESVKALERLINSPEVPMEVRARMRGYGRLAERKTPQGKARWVEQMSNKLEAEIDRHYRTRNVRTLRSLLRPFATEYAPNRRKLRERVGEEARADLNFAQRLLNNSEATPPEGMTDERRDELIDIFGDVGNRQSNPTRVKAALEIAGSIAKGGRTARDEFKDQRREDNADLANQVTAQVLNTEDAMDASEITANERSKNKFSKFVSNAASVAVRGMEGLQQQLNKLDRVKGGFLETMFLSAAFQAQQTELAMNNEQADQTMKDFETVLGSDSKVAAAWYKGSHKMHQTDIEWINNKKVGMKKRKMSKQQGVSLLMQWLDPSLRPTFTNMGINESTIEQVKEFIGEIGVSEAYYFREKYAEMGIKLNAKHMEVEGIPLDMIDGYGGRARRQRGATKEEDMQMFAKNSAGRPTVKSGSMKERTNSVDYLMFMDADTDFTAHSREVNHYISHAELAHNMSAAFLNNEDARNAIKQKHGSKFYSSLAAQIEAIIGGDPQTTDLERILTEVRSNLTKASLMVKPAIMIKQLTSAPAFAEEIGPVAFAKASAAMLKPANLKKFMPMIWKSQYVKNRMSSSQFTDVQNSLDARSNVMRSLRWHDWAMINIKIGDIGAVVMGGTPVYYHAYTEAKASGMTDDQAQFKAEEVFGIASERAQQSSATHAQGSFLRDKTWMRSWFMYLTSPLQYQRNVNTAIGNFVAQSIEWKNDRPSDAKKAAKQAANAFLIYHVLLPQIFQAVASGLVGFTDDEDYIKEKFAKRQLRALMLGNLNTFPLLGSFLSGLANSISGADETFNSSGSPVLDLVMKTNAKWNKALKDGEDMSKFTDVLIEASQLGGIPAKTAISYYEAITDVSEGNTEHPLLRLGGWSKYATMED